MSLEAIDFTSLAWSEGTWRSLRVACKPIICFIRLYYIFDGQYFKLVKLYHLTTPKAWQPWCNWALQHKKEVVFMAAIRHAFCCYRCFTDALLLQWTDFAAMASSSHCVAKEPDPPIFFPMMIISNILMVPQHRFGPIVFLPTHLGRAQWSFFFYMTPSYSPRKK